MKKVEKTSSKPLHFQLAEIIKDMIENGELKEGDAILPERELCELQNVSRMTVNKAIMGLVSEGLLYRQQGKGTFVSKGKTTNKFSHLKGFTEVMAEKGITVKTDILSFEVGKQSDVVRKNLNITNDTELIYKIKRLRYIENDPFAIETTYVAQSKVSNLNEELVNNTSLYKVLKEGYGYKIKSANQTIEPIMLSEEEADLLSQDTKTLALKFKRSTYIENGELLEYTISIFRSDKYQYEIVLSE